LNILDRSVNSIRAWGFRGFLRGAWDSALAQAVLLYESVIFTLATDRVIGSFGAKSAKVKGIGPIVDFSFAFSYLGIAIKPVQVKSEIAGLLTRLKDRRIKAMMEIGTDRGGTLFLFSRVAEPDATIVSMNVPWSALNAYCMEYRNLLFEKFARPEQKLSLLSVNSHEHASLQKMKALLNGQKLDFLFIDGDHSYDGVKKDFEMYSALVGKGGVICFHDIAENRRNTHNPVRDYWDEIKSGYKHEELCHSGGKGFGIGILYK
jgi:predicted O-methyltransferase YrrM